MNTYAAELIDNTVTRVIVGNAAWATEHLGGTWVDTPSKCGPGWLLVDGELVPPPAPEIPDDLSD